MTPETTPILPKNVAAVRGGEGLSLSAISARVEQERTERFPFEVEDKQLVDSVHAILNGARQAPRVGRR